VGLCRSGSITAAARELARCKLDLAGVKEFKRDKVGTVTLKIIFFVEKETKVINRNTIFCILLNCIRN